MVKNEKSKKKGRSKGKGKAPIMEETEDDPTSKELLSLPSIKSTKDAPKMHRTALILRAAAATKCPGEREFKEAANEAHWINGGKTGGNHHLWSRVVILQDSSGLQFYHLQKCIVSSTSGKAAWNIRWRDLMRDEYYFNPSNKGDYLNGCKVVAMVNKAWVEKHVAL